MEGIWTVVQCYGTQSILNTGLNRSLMQEILDKLAECEGRMSELLINSASDKKETNSPIKMTHHEGNDEVANQSRTRKRTMRSKLVKEKINDMKKKM